MGSFALELLLCVLAFGFGYAANQGGTCLVVAAHELHRRQPPKMFVGFLAASAAAGLVAVPIVWTGTLGATLAPSTSINFLLLIGAIAFGLGALINDTCLLGSLARRDGEMRLLPTLGINDWYLGCRPWQVRLRFNMAKQSPNRSATDLVTLAFLVCARAAGTRFRFHEERSANKAGLVVRRFDDWTRYHWRTSICTLAGLDLRRRDSTRPSSQNVPGRRGRAHCGDLFDRRRLTASFRQGNLRLQLPTANGILRSVVGGTLMGIGIALIPGGNDGLILAAVPTLSPGGIVAYLLMTTTIVFGFAARGKVIPALPFTAMIRATEDLPS